MLKKPGASLKDSFLEEAEGTGFGVLLMCDATAIDSQGFILEKRIGVGRNPCHCVYVGEPLLSLSQAIRSCSKIARQLVIPARQQNRASPADRFWWQTVKWTRTKSRSMVPG